MGVGVTISLGTPSTRAVAIIGDSLTVAGGGGETAIKSRLQTLGYESGKLWWYAVSGKAINIADTNGRLTVNDIAQARSDLGVEPSCWVIALGTNGYDNSSGTNTTRINSLISALTAAPRVLWVGVSINPTNANETSYNSLEAGLVNAQPNHQFLDWNTYFKAQPNQGTLWNGDGIHYTTAGYNIRHDWLAAQIGAPL